MQEADDATEKLAEPCAVCLEVPKPGETLRMLVLGLPASGARPLPLPRAARSQAADEASRPPGIAPHRDESGAASRPTRGKGGGPA